MKKLNKKGFTLIELLAVIIILAILIAVAVPSVTRYLDGARKDTYVENAKQIIKAVKLDYDTGHENAEISTRILGAIGTETIYKYDINAINNLLDKDLKQSPFGEDYDKNSFVRISTFSISPTVASITICLMDEGGNGFHNYIYDGMKQFDFNNPGNYSQENFDVSNKNPGTSANSITKDKVFRGFTGLHC